VTTDFLSDTELSALGFAAVGGEVRISRGAAIYSPHLVSIGDRSRIDAFAVLSTTGGIVIGRNVHISAHVTIAGSEQVTLEDFVSVSIRATLLTANDDFRGAALHGPTVPDEFRHVHAAPIRVARHAMIGAGSVVLPGVTIGAGAAVGALSLVKDDVAPGMVVAGIPAREIGRREPGYEDLAAQYLAKLDDSR
jgi:dTDP-4-amino-4,6-dideoxy-D-glucose acyltransferase